MKNLCLVKIGGSAITDISKPNTPRRGEIIRISKEIHAARKHVSIIVGHGSGSFGHVPAAKYKVQLGLINSRSLEGASMTQHAAAMLHRIVIGEMFKVGLKPASFPPANAITSGGRIKEWYITPIMRALENGFLPVTYGDVTMDLKQGVAIVSTEEALRYLANELKPSRIILGSDIDGVFTSNPKIDTNARLISRIDSRNIGSALSGASGSTKVDVTGGMRTKLKYLYEMSKNTGAEGMIVNINVPGRLYKAMLGKHVVGTVVKYE
ncbi:MAG: isopentenyl phosphate kinase [Candidatus Micrarchaeia archaeon]